MIKILKLTALFIITFIIGSLIFIPYNKIVSFALYTNLPDMEYSALEAGPFATSIKDVSYKKENVGNLEFKYSPLSIITKSIDVKIESMYGKGEVKKRGKKVNLDFTLNSKSLMNRIKNAEIKGEINISATYNISDLKGNISLKSDAIDLSYNGIKLNQVKLDSLCDIDNQTIIINNLKMSGKNNLNLEGQIKINKKIELSRFNIKGDTDFLGIQQKFILTGDFNKPSFRLL